MDFTLHRIVMSSAAYGAYAYPYAAYAYTGCRNAAGAAVPCAYHNVAKRSADAEADASPYFYGGYYGGYPYAAAYGAYPYAYAAYAYNSPCKNGAGFPVPCAAHTVAKRSAEAEVLLADGAVTVTVHDLETLLELRHLLLGEHVEDIASSLLRLLRRSFL